MKKFVLILVLLGLSIAVSCKKEEPTTCEETCVATPLTSGFKSNIVGKWRFYKIEWFYETLGGGSILTYKDTVELGNRYELEIHENGTIDYYRNDSFINTKKLEIYYEYEWTDHPDGYLGFISAYLNCVKNTQSEVEHAFKCTVRYQDTLALKYHPIYYRNESINERSGRGLYYRVPE